MSHHDPGFDRVVDAVRGIPHMKEGRARQLTEFLRRERPQHVLELGTSHGVSTCYLAAAVADHGGRVTTMDRSSAARLDPNVYGLLDRLELRDRVDVVLAERSFTWELMKLIRDHPDQRFDFCYFDGGHTWDVTGYAFFLVDRLLEPGSWILFDDLEWTMAGSTTVDKHGIPDEELHAAQIGLVFDLLVANGGGYGGARRDGNWGWAQKLPEDVPEIVARASSRWRSTVERGRAIPRRLRNR